MSKTVEVKLHFISPIERNAFAAVEIHKKEVQNIRMGHDGKGYWVKYKIKED